MRGSCRHRYIQNLLDLHRECEELVHEHLGGDPVFEQAMKVGVVVRTLQLRACVSLTRFASRAPECLRVHCSQGTLRHMHQRGGAVHVLRQGAQGSSRQGSSERNRGGEGASASRVPVPLLEGRCLLLVGGCLPLQQVSKYSHPH